MPTFRAATLSAFLSLTAMGTTYAADLPTRKGAPVPPPVSTSCKETEATALSADVFGFSSGSDVSDLGAWAAGLTYQGGFKGAGFKPGSFSGHAGQLQFSTSFLPCWEVGPYLLGSTSKGSFRGMPGDVSFTSYGVGIENKLKVLGRATHGVGLTFVFDPNYQRYDQKDSTIIPIALGWTGAQVGATYKMLLDAELIKGKLFGALNLQLDQSWVERPFKINPLGSDYARGSNLTFSGALSYQLVDGLFVGGEARYVRTHAGNFLNQYTGDAVFVGPTFFWQASKALSISGAYGIQVAGNAKAINGAVLAPIFAASNINLASANQHIAKVKVGYAF